MNATRKTYRPEVYAEPILISRKAGTRSHKIAVVALLPERLKDTRDPRLVREGRAIPTPVVRVIVDNTNVGDRIWDAGGGQDNSCSACLLRRSTNVQDHFDLQAWPCVAEDFDILKVMKSVLESIATDQPVDDNDLNLLQGKLKKQFSGKKFLLVLDDPWNDNYNHWRTSAVHLNLVHWAGSKVVITTRSMNVATMMATTSIYPLEYLSDEDYLCILAEKSLGTIDFSNHSTMIRNPVSERSSQHIDIREDNNIEDHKAHERRNWTRSKSE
ncbi:putative disease resistance protein RGA3 [Citrus clementina]|uniref:putative disease resistance protein RGA3 n=1 Tax=Citrus clementina TaxID=85681 RepID=UPI000CED151C|nr:putative disease resistance protein RGA3 [Citrus x clementina]